MTDYVAYMRVSTQEQGNSGLGLDAQRSAIDAYLKHNNGFALEYFTEIESGKRADRPNLKSALELARRKNAILIISKLDRLSRNVAFIAALMDSKVKFIALDMPGANEFTVHIMAAVAEQERKAISKRTSDALQAKKRQGARLGLSNPKREDAVKVSKLGSEAVISAADAYAEKMRPVLEGLKASGICSYKALADQLNAMGQRTARGGSWYPTTVKNLIQRLEGAQIDSLVEQIVL
jgi:DNA invertase Pin-like site-specific DNA recombinase